MPGRGLRGALGARRERFRATLSAVAARSQAGSRAGKWELYGRAFPPRRGERVLDVGVSSHDDIPNENYFLRRYPYGDQLTAVGIDDLSQLRQRHPEVTFVNADGRRLPFPDLSFDVVHSNAVVEHVGTSEDQRQFVAELVRVGRAGFITTPNRWFPIETHSMAPVVHWLPHSVAMRILTMLRQPNLNWRLLGPQTFRRLFPPSVTLTVHSTKVLGWPVTLVVVYRRPANE